MLPLASTNTQRIWITIAVTIGITIESSAAVGVELILCVVAIVDTIATNFCGSRVELKVGIIAVALLFGETVPVIIIAGGASIDWPSQCVYIVWKLCGTGSCGGVFIVTVTLIFREAIAIIIDIHQGDNIK